MSKVAASRASGPLVLALDVGTSSVRAQLYDSRARLISGTGARLPSRVRTTPDGGAEMDPDELFERTTGVVDDVLAKASSLSSQVGAVAMSTFWHSVMGVRPDGAAATPLYLWADSRSSQAMGELRARLEEPAVHARTGCMLHWSYLPAKLLWLATARPMEAQQSSGWMSFGEYAQLRIFGETACSLSMASGTGLLNQHTCQWDSEVLSALGISPEQLSLLVEVDRALRHPRAEYAARWPQLRDVPWYPAVGDGAASNVGSGCVTRDKMALMVGTSGALRVAWPAQRVTIPAGAWCYRIDGRRCVMGGALSNGGNLFAWMRNTLTLGRIEDAEGQLASMEVDAHGLTVLPFLAGERSPGYAPRAKGAIVGLTSATRPIDILRAGLEAVALRFSLLHEILLSQAPNARQVVATGGALLRSPAWTQMMADALGTPVVVSGEPEASSRGAALLALEGLGAVGNVEEVPASLGRVYEPKPSRHARFQAAQERHRRYYEQLIKAPL